MYLSANIFRIKCLLNNSGNIIDYMKIKEISKNIFSLVFNLVLIECTHLMEVYIMHSYFKFEGLKMKITVSENLVKPSNIPMSCSAKQVI